MKFVKYFGSFDTFISAKESRGKVVIIISFIGVLTVYALRRIVQKSTKLVPTKKDAIFITGCDSGLGYSMAYYCHQKGMTVFAGCLNLQSEGSADLQTLENVHIIEFDVTDDGSIKKAALKINSILLNQPDVVLKTLVNNAGVMIFGNFAWQNKSLIEKQITINLIGAMIVTKEFISQIIKSKGRIINVCSHCSMEALPGLSVYAASKAGLLAWSNALRVELKKFQVNVISFIPGSFPLATNILSNQAEYAREMQQNLSEDDWNFYKSYFLRYNAYLCGLGKPKLAIIQDKNFYSLFENALLNIFPKSYYCNWPLRYRFYHCLFKITPTSIRDYLIVKFMNMPEWEN